MIYFPAKMPWVGVSKLYLTDIFIQMRPDRTFISSVFTWGNMRESFKGFDKMRLVSELALKGNSC
jgi:hypothetical protein